MKNNIVQNIFQYEKHFHRAIYPIKLSCRNVRRATARLPDPAGCPRIRSLYGTRTSSWPFPSAHATLPWKHRSGSGRTGQHNHTKPIIRVPVRGLIPVAIRAARGVRLVVPTAAANDTARRFCCPPKLNMHIHATTLPILQIAPASRVPSILATIPLTSPVSFHHDSTRSSIS